jgi:hypothetical protein
VQQFVAISVFNDLSLNTPKGASYSIATNWGGASSSKNKNAKIK